MDLGKDDYLLSDDIVVRSNEINQTYKNRIEKYRNEIELVWKNEKRNKKIFNNKILNLEEIEKNKQNTLLLHCYPIEYKHYLAQRNGIDLGITPLAVSGITYYIKDKKKKLLLDKDLMM